MAPRYFGQFLLERGLIEPAALVKAVEAQGRMNRPLGVLAVHQGRLTMAQVRALRRDQRTSGAALGVLAVRSGLLREEDVAALDQCIREQWMYIGEALVQAGALTDEQMWAALKEYHAAQAAHEGRLHTDLGRIPHPDVVDALLHHTFEVLLNMTGQIAKANRMWVGGPPDDADRISFLQHVEGDVSWEFGLHCARPVLHLVASKLCDGTEPFSDEVATDAFAEFVNIVVGRACLRFTRPGERPVVYPVAMLPAGAVPRARRPQVAVALSLPQGELVLSVAFSG